MAFEGIYTCSENVEEYESPSALTFGNAINPHLKPSARGASDISSGNQVPFGQNNALLSKINC